MITEKQIKELAVKSLLVGNPYIKRAICFYKDMRPMYIYANEIMTKDQMYLDTAMHDIKKGYQERMVGYYDKWYSYNHADEGRAYDYGVELAAMNIECSEKFHIIECMH